MTVSKVLELPINGESPDVDRLMSTCSYIMDKVCRLAIDNTVTNNQNIIKNAAWVQATSSNAIVTHMNTEAVVHFCKVYDVFNDSSVDATRWTSASALGGSITEGATAITIDSGGGGSASILSVGSSLALDARAASGNSEWVFRCSTVNAGGTAKIQVSNGTNHIDLITTNSATIYVYNVIFNKAAQTCRLFRDGVEQGGSPFDISTATTNWYFRAAVTAGGATNTVEIRFLGYLDGATADGYVTTGTTTLAVSSDVGIVSANSSVTGEAESFTTMLSANAGSNFSTGVGNGILQTIPVAGTSGQVRLSVPLVTSLSTTVPNIPYTHTLDWAAFFG